MTPTAYKARYEKLQVPLADGTVSEVTVNQYRLRGLPGHDVNVAAEKAFFNALEKHHVDMQLRVDPGTRSLRILHRNRDSSFSVTEQTQSGPENVNASFLKQISTMARYVFVGKGAPEHCQLILQLVDHWKLAPAGLQDYANKALGLDCNGFVGNYILHGKRQADWTSLGVGNHDEGPDMSIDGFFDHRTPVTRQQDLSPARSYILGMVNAANLVIPGGGSVADAGHIVITEPGRFRPGTPGQRPGLGAVESTAGHDPGLWESWYSIVKDHGSGIYTVDREAMGAYKIVRFKIVVA